MSFPQVAWIKSPPDVTGQDQLGVRFPSEFIYSSLLFGITNVTDRCRYYSFYTWIIWAFEKHQGNLKSKHLYEVIRRADCLLTLIGIYHERHRFDDIQINHNWLHGALIGSAKLGAALSDIEGKNKKIKLSQYAAPEEGPDRYFKNKYGGLGQYYLGPLRDAGIISSNGEQQLCYTVDKGLPIAEAFEKAVNREDFFSVLERDKAGEDDLKRLKNFCPCQIAGDSDEQNRLLDFFFERSDPYRFTGNAHRRQSLLLLVDFIAQSKLTISINSSGVHQFLAAVYGNSFADGTGWEIDSTASPGKNEIRRLWQQYYANELLSYAVQSLFWAGLTEMAAKDNHPANAAAYGHWLAETFNNLGDEIDTTQKFAEAVELVKLELPALSDWNNKSHEIQLAWELESVVRDRNLSEKRQRAIALSLQLLLTLIARWWDQEMGDKRFPLQYPAEYSLNYPINLKTFFEHAAGEWQNFNIREWLAWLGSQWGVETHLKIAIRKLRHENLDTFKIIPTEYGLCVTEVIGNKTISEILLPGFTSPRIRQTLQILTDLRVLKITEKGLEPSPLGQDLLEELADG